MEHSKQARFRRAKKQIEHIKGFYRHLTFYTLINTILLVVKANIFGFFTAKGVEDHVFFDWLEWNIILTPILWGIGLLIHGMYVFKYKSLPLNQLKPKFLSDWEEKQIKKYMGEENRT